jgi:formate dehydrogenase subunit gamma
MRNRGICWHRRGIGYGLAGLLLFLLLPLLPYAFVDDGARASPIEVPNPAVELWRTVRQRDLPANGLTQVQGVDSGALMHAQGEAWRHFRMQQLIPGGAIVLGAMLGALLLFRLLRGRILIEGGRSGKLVPRFSVNQRLAHWFLASLFILLALTGLVLLYGRFVLIPLLGADGFSATAAACKEAHNLFGPIFPFALLMLLALFLRGNRFSMVDIRWFAKAGGLLGGHPASSGYYNGGEKAWYWLVILLGIVISTSGLVLNFPLFGQGRDIMTWAHIAHGLAAIVLIGGALGHIYIGSVGMEGAFDSIANGYVDANWAKEHHDLWYAQMEQAGMVDVEPNALEEIKRHDKINVHGQG